GAKGFIDGAVTFHEVTPDLTRIVLILEYHPKGLFEKTGNLWRAQGRRARLELKHFARHVMTQSILHPDDVEGWRGEIRDGQVVEPEEDEAQPEESEELEESDEDEGEEPAEADEDEDEEPEEAEAEEDEADEGEGEDEEEEEEEAPPPPRRRGRPRKTAAAAVDQAPKQRGRPRKATATKTSSSRQGARR
ncbi:cyclase, partial [Rhodococcus jostii]